MSNSATTQVQTVLVGILGYGGLFEAVRQRLSLDLPIQPLEAADLDGTTSSHAVLLVVDEGRDHRLRSQVDNYRLKQGVPALFAHAEAGEAVIGPCVFPEEEGCTTCAEARELNAREDAEEYRKLHDNHGGGLAGAHQGWLTRFGVEVVAGLIVDEVVKALEAPDRARTRNALIRLTLNGLRSSVHRFLPDPLCPRCGNLPDDTPEAAAVVTKPRPKVSTASYRVRSLSAEKDGLLARYVDSKVGVVRRLSRNNASVYPKVSAPMGLGAGRKTETGFGRALDYEAGQLTAVTEALERYGGIQPRGKKTMIRASYAQLSEQEALNPEELGLHSEEQYAQPNFPYRPYHHNLTLNWVWGYSFAKQRPILVPEAYAYYGMHDGSAEDHPFVYEISNGCAFGGCLEEAILYGILEVAERDAFLMTWYAELGVPRIDPSSAKDSTAALVIERIEFATGYTVRAFNITVEQGIPCFWVMAVDEEDRPDRPKALCAAGSHLDPEKALINALLELTPMIDYMSFEYPNKRDQTLRMVRDPYAVVRMEDHSLLYCASEAFDRFAFLSASHRQTFVEAFADFYRQPQSTDLLLDLSRTVTKYLGSGLDVVVVDQTTPEHAAGDFRCVKVIIPGTLPMTFGYHAQRVSGVERLYRIPCDLGYRSRRLTDDDLNPHPHPFP